MALIDCKECGKEVSKKAESCPHCGAPLKKQPTQYGCGTLILMLIVVFILIGVFLPDDRTPTQRAEDNCADETMAQNSFGAMIRTKYYAEIKNEKGTENWRLLDVKMYE